MVEQAIKNDWDPLLEYATSQSDPLDSDLLETFPLPLPPPPFQGQHDQTNDDDNEASNGGNTNTNTNETKKNKPTWKWGDFSFVESERERNMLENAFRAIDRLELWAWLRDIDPDMGFMFLSCPEINRIGEEMVKEPVGRLHSGASFGITMRNMEYIAKHSFDAFIQMWLDE